MLRMIDDKVPRGVSGKVLEAPWQRRMRRLAGFCLLTGLSLLTAHPVWPVQEGRLLPVTKGVTKPVPVYVIGKEDLLKVSVFGEKDLTMEQVPVRPDGKISLPLLGDVVAAGMTPENLGEALTVLYADHVRAPSVTVMVTSILSQKVYMLGKIKSAGVLPLGSEMRLLQALALSGGFADFANTKRILVIREENGVQRRIEVNYEKIVSGEKMETNLKLKAGDTVVVP